MVRLLDVLRGVVERHSPICTHTRDEHDNTVSITVRCASAGAPVRVRRLPVEKSSSGARNSSSAPSLTSLDGLEATHREADAKHTHSTHSTTEERMADGRVCRRAHAVVSEAHSGRAQWYTLSASHSARSLGRPQYTRCMSSCVNRCLFECVCFFRSKTSADSCFSLPKRS